MPDKTHYRKAFNSPYLSAEDISGPTNLTIARVALEPDKTQKTQDRFNTAYFKESEIRPGEKLKPMILNVTNSVFMKKKTKSEWIDDWVDVPVSVYVVPTKMMGKNTTGLRLKDQEKRPEVLPDTQNWENAKNAYLRDGNFDSVLKHADISEDNQLKIMREVADVS